MWCKNAKIFNNKPQSIYFFFINYKIKSNITKIFGEDFKSLNISTVE